MTVQLLAIDGVTVHLPQDTTPGAMVQMAGGRFKVVPCPDVSTSARRSRSASMKSS